MQTDNTSGAGERSATELFFSLIRCGIGNEKALPYTPTPEQWHELFDIAKKQTLAGIAFAGIKELQQEQRPPKEILLQWFQLSNIIQKKNAGLNRKSAFVAERFLRDGFRNCILKGQGAAQLYPDPTLRTPGDIDIWLEGGHEKVLTYVKKYINNCDPTYHHVDFPITPDLDIEIHYRPTWMYNPFADKRMQAYFDGQADEQFCNTVHTAEGNFNAPTATFNRIYMLLHIYRHLFFEGIGMRQLLDYYFVMKQGMTDKEKELYRNTTREFGIERFAGAVMYVMQHMFHLDCSQMPVEPNTRHGKFLLREVMLAGNFGKHDTRYIQNEGIFPKLFNNTRRLLTLMWYYPQEALWIPYFKLWHWFWRRRNRKERYKSDNAG